MKGQKFEIDKKILSKTNENNDLQLYYRPKVNVSLNKNIMSWNKTRYVHQWTNIAD